MQHAGSLNRIRWFASLTIFVSTLIILSFAPPFSAAPGGPLPPKPLPAKTPKASAVHGPAATGAGISADLLTFRRGQAPAPGSKGRIVHKLGLLPSAKKPGIYRGTPPRMGPIEKVLAAKVDRSSFLPPVGDQGSQNSCAAWSTGYYYKAFQEKHERGWDARTTDHQFSPTFLYNQVAPFDEGSTFDEMFNLLTNQGCAPLSACPYTETDVTAWPPYAAFRAAIPYRAADYTRLGDGLTPDIILAMKTRLAVNADACVIGIPIYRPSPTEPGRFDLLSATDDQYLMPGDADRYNAGGHAVAKAVSKSSTPGAPPGATTASPTSPTSS